VLGAIAAPGAPGKLSDRGERTPRPRRSGWRCATLRRGGCVDPEPQRTGARVSGARRVGAGRRVCCFALCGLGWRVLRGWSQPPGRRAWCPREAAGWAREKRWNNTGDAGGFPGRCALRRPHGLCVFPGLTLQGYPTAILLSLSFPPCEISAIGSAFSPYNQRHQVLPYCTHTLAYLPFFFFF
jgi:hypothetical protein